MEIVCFIAFFMAVIIPMVFDAPEEKQGGSDELASVWHGPVVVLESE